MRGFEPNYEQEIEGYEQEVEGYEQTTCKRSGEANGIASSDTELERDTIDIHTSRLGITRGFKNPRGYG